MSPNSPSPYNRKLSVRIPQTLFFQLEKLAKQTGRTLTEIALEIITHHVAHIEITEEEYIIIENRVKKARKK